MNPLWSEQTQRALDNFQVSGQPMPGSFIRALARIKAAAAEANAELGLLDPTRGRAIRRAALEVATGRHADQFPVDVFQTGSGTSTNMNANEVIAQLATRYSRRTVHPNDHVNCGQSSNDVIPTAIHVSATVALKEDLLSTLAHLQRTIERRARETRNTVKTGRTHLMDAMPLTLGQELSGWAAQIGSAQARLRTVMPRLQQLALGGTAVGTGINAHPRFAAAVCRKLARHYGITFRPGTNYFESLSSQDTAAELSGQLKGLAVVLLKISNDLRWMNSGPLAGLGEIELPALQAGSSIMPGKVNPVIPESVAMACTQVIGLDTAVTLAAASGNFQLNTMLPLIANNLLQQLQLMSSASRMLADKAIARFRVRKDRLDEALVRNPILVTALNGIIGYEAAAAIAKQAYRERRPVLEVARERTQLDERTLRRLLDPARLTRGGIVKRS